MLKIKNKSELMEAIANGAVKTLFLTPKIEQKVIESLSDNVAMFEDAYGPDGNGGYICILNEEVTEEAGRNEYLIELGEYNLHEDEWEFDDVLGTDGTFEIHMQLFVMTEWNIMLIFRKKVL